MGLLVGVAQLFSFAVVIIFYKLGNDSNSSFIAKITKKRCHMPLNQRRMLSSRPDNHLIHQIEPQTTLLKIAELNSVSIHHHNIQNRFCGFFLSFFYFCCGLFITNFLLTFYNSIPIIISFFFIHTNFQRSFCSVSLYD